MEIVPTLVILFLGGIFGVSVTVGYFAYDAQWKKDETKREWLKMRVFELDADMSKSKEWRAHYQWRIEQMDERLKALDEKTSVLCQRYSEIKEVAE
jgi:hypothetical protein